MSKYHNKKLEVDGVKYDSKAEMYRHTQLKAMERDGVIRDLKCQVAFELAPSVKYDGAVRKKPALRYVADFTYIKTGQLVIEDVKGMETAVFKIKRHLMKVMGHEIRIVKCR